MDLILTAFLHYQDELPRFGRTVIPLVRRQSARKRTDHWAAREPAVAVTSLPADAAPASS